MTHPDAPKDRWITDTQISTRFPYYTRANADEVGPDPFSPLGWSLGWAKGCVPGVAQGFIDFGVVTRDEFVVDPPEVFGNWGGYFYNQLSLPRVMGCRMPGASPEAIDQAYFGDHPGVPPYTPHPQDENEAQTAKLAERMGWVMSTPAFPEQEAAAVRSREVADERPDLSSASNSELVARGRAMALVIDEVWVPYCQSCLAASLGPGAVQAICAAIGRSDDAVKVLSGVGDVDSAEASFVMWDISRMVQKSRVLMTIFDGPTNEIIKAASTSGDPEAKAFVSAWNALIVEHGHRGPNEWDMRSHSWTTNPEITLSMIERLRHQDDARSPYLARQKAATERERIAAELLALVEGDAETHGTLKAAMASAGLFFSMRERGKSATIRVIHEAKLAFMELGRRMVAEGVVSDPQQVFMLLDSELDAFVLNPQSFKAIISERDVQYAALYELEPPYIVKLEEGVPPISSWAKRGSAKSDHGVAKAGDVLQGAGGAPGVVTGVARVVLDPNDPSAVGPGDIMIAPTTDPSWTPLFLAAGGVVVNVGAVASHAAIVCRELGVPCAVSVVDATSRIPDGATITIDGSSGRVTIDGLP
jgi:rifampicin phosphotransferase